MRLMVVLGTRPEVIKLAPVISALRAKPDDFETVVCSTGSTGQCWISPSWH